MEYREKNDRERYPEYAFRPALEAEPETRNEKERIGALELYERLYQLLAQEEGGIYGAEGPEPLEYKAAQERAEGPEPAAVPAAAAPAQAAASPDAEEAAPAAADAPAAALPPEPAPERFSAEPAAAAASSEAAAPLPAPAGSVTAAASSEAAAPLPAPAEAVTAAASSEAAVLLTVPAEPDSAEPASAPASVPAAAHHRKAAAAGELERLTRTLHYTESRLLPKIYAELEEDILVPDSKPDLAAVLLVDGDCRLGERKLHTGAESTLDWRPEGELLLKVFYRPVSGTAGDLPFRMVEARVPFRGQTREEFPAGSEVVFTAEPEALDCTVVNERKLRLKGRIAVEPRIYQRCSRNLFQGIKGQDLQLRKRDVPLSESLYRTSESTEVEASFPLKDGNRSISRILSRSLRVTENHRQISAGKAVVNATLFCDVLCLEEGEDGREVPVFHREKTEFTQFLKLEAEGDLSGSTAQISFRVVDADLRPAEHRETGSSALQLSARVETALELTAPRTVEVVTDFYHPVKELSWEPEQQVFRRKLASGTAEVSARELLPLAEGEGLPETVIYAAARPVVASCTAGNGKVTAEGTVQVNLLWLTAGEEGTAQGCSLKLPFRGTAEAPGTKPGDQAAVSVQLADLWYDGLGGRRPEVNTGLLLKAETFREEPVATVGKVFDSGEEAKPFGDYAMIIYRTEPGDTLWSVSKKYRVPAESIAEWNRLTPGKEPAPGTGLLLVRTA
ncbi:MAG: DUF3794 domain-containing protein [Clostridiales bacterium]|nr:DUF3794 domain-containing protein [Clostridiales bacterium]